MLLPQNISIKFCELNCSILSLKIVLSCFHDAKAFDNERFRTFHARTIEILELEQNMFALVQQFLWGKNTL
jgi:hypothetical protein